VIIITEKLLNIKKIYYSYNNKDILKNISIDLNKGEIHAIVGKEGSGKNDLVKGLAGLNDGLTGEVYYKNINILNYSRNEMIRKTNISFIFSEFHLSEELSVMENIIMFYYPERKKMPLLIDWPRLKKESLNLLEKLEINNLNLKMKVKYLPLEEKRLITIARAFKSYPDVIIMNDPLKELNKKYIRVFYNTIKEFAKNGRGVFFVTNLWEEAIRIADRISILSNGEIQGSFSSVEAKKNPRMLVSYLNSDNYYFNISQETSKNKQTEGLIDIVKETAKLLSSENELRDILTLLTEKVTQCLKSSGCRIYLFDEESGAIMDDLVYKEKKELAAKLEDKVIFDLIYNNQEILYYNKNNPEFTSLFLENNDIRTVICVPLIVRNQVVGVVQVFYDDIYVYSKEDKNYLQALAKQIAIAIEDTRLMWRSKMLQESHHRIKNNLQSIVGLVDFQRKIFEKGEKPPGEILDDIIAQIKSIATVHDLLAQEKMGRSIINIKKLIKSIVKFTPIKPKITIVLDIEDIFLSYNKAASIALVVNELITNCIKHAFDKKNEGKIEIKCFLDKKADKISLKVKDNGKGLPKGFIFNDEIGLGLSLARSIVEKEFHGKMELSNKNGTIINITFSRKKLILEDSMI